MKEPIYIVEDAAEIVHNNLSSYLQDKFSVEDIIEVLELKFRQRLMRRQWSISS